MKAFLPPLLAASLPLACAQTQNHPVAPASTPTSLTVAPATSAEAHTQGVPRTTTVSEEDAAVPIFSDDPVWGSRDALVTIVVFMDLQCPACKLSFTSMTPLRQRADAPRIVWKHFPIRSHPSAHAAAAAASGVYALGGIDAFLKFAGTVFDAPGSVLSKSDFLRYAKHSGIADEAALSRGLDAGTWNAPVERGIKTGTALDVNGVPSLFINGRPYEMESLLEDFSNGRFDKELAVERDKAEAKRRAGVGPLEIYTVMSHENVGHRTK